MVNLNCIPSATLSPPARLSAPWHYVFVDFENVQEIDLAVMGTRPTMLTLLLGAKQTRLRPELVEKLMTHAGAVELLRLTSSGKNALDLALAYYVGRAAVLDPKGHFHFVSKDKGFDPLVEHLNSRHIRAYRHSDFSTLAFSAAFKAAPSPQKAPAAVVVSPLQRALENWKKNPNNRPKKQKKLIRYLQSMLGRNATEKDAQELTNTLIQNGHLQIDENEVVTYHLPK